MQKLILQASSIHIVTKIRYSIEMDLRKMIFKLYQ